MDIGPKGAKQPSDAVAAKLARDNWDAFKRATEAPAHVQFLRDADKYNRAYFGDAWEQNEIQALEDRPHTNHNLLQGIVNTIVAQHYVTRFQVMFSPATDDEAAIKGAALRNRLWMFEQSRTLYEQAENQMILDAYVEDRGFMRIGLDFDNSMSGWIKFKCVDPRTIAIDPNAKEYDPETWGYFTESDWVTLQRVEELYGKKVADQVRSLSTDQTYGSNSIVYESESNTYGGDPVGSTSYGEDAMELRAVRMVRYVSRQYKRYVKRNFFVDQATGDMTEVPDDMSEEQAQDLAAREGLTFVSRTVPRIRWTVTFDHVVAHDDWSPYPWFDIVPFFPVFRRGRSSGLASQLYDPQRTVNKITSQIIHIVNGTANSGWIVDSNALVNMTPDELEQKGDRPKQVIVKTPNSVLEKITPNTIPTGLERILSNTISSMQFIAGATNPVLGQMSSEASSAAINSQAVRALSRNEIATENLAYTRVLLIRRVMHLWAEFYTEERALPFRPMTTIGQNAGAVPETVIVNEQQPDGTVANDLTLRGFTFILSAAPSKDTYNEQQLAEILALRAQGIAIPDDRIIEYSNLSDRMELAKEVRELLGRGEMTEADRAMAEMRYTAEMAQLQASVQLAQGEVMKLEAEIMKLAAEAQATGAGDDGQAANALRMAELEAQLLGKREELITRIKLAEIAARNKLDIAAISVRGKQIGELEARGSMVVRERMQDVRAAADRALQLQIANITRAARDAAKGGQ